MSKILQTKKLFPIFMGNVRNFYCRIKPPIVGPHPREVSFFSNFSLSKNKLIAISFSFINNFFLYFFLFSSHFPLR